MLYYFETNCNFYFETIYCTLYFFGRRLEWNGSKPPEACLIYIFRPRWMLLGGQSSTFERSQAIDVIQLYCNRYPTCSMCIAWQDLFLKKNQYCIANLKCFTSSEKMVDIFEPHPKPYNIGTYIAYGKDYPNSFRAWSLGLRSFAPW